MLVWLICVLVFFSLDLSCMGLSVLPEVWWLFSFHVNEVFNYNLFKDMLRPFLFFSDYYIANVAVFNVFLWVWDCSHFFSFFFAFLFHSTYFHHCIFQLTYPFFCISYSVIDFFYSEKKNTFSILFLVFFIYHFISFSHFIFYHCLLYLAL